MALLAAYFFLGALWRRLYAFEHGYDQIHFIETNDGWRISSPVKRFRILGRGYGESYDYGHGDLLIGKACRQEVYPALVEWVEDVEGVRGAAGD